jgi:hypothetical protein
MDGEIPEEPIDGGDVNPTAGDAADDALNEIASAEAELSEAKTEAERVEAQKKVDDAFDQLDEKSYERFGLEKPPQGKTFTEILQADDSELNSNEKNFKKGFEKTLQDGKALYDKFDGDTAKISESIMEKLKEKYGNNVDKISKILKYSMLAISIIGAIAGGVAVWMKNFSNELSNAFSGCYMMTSDPSKAGLQQFTMPVAKLGYTGKNGFGACPSGKGFGFKGSNDNFAPYSKDTAAQSAMAKNCLCSGDKATSYIQTGCGQNKNYMPAGICSDGMTMYGWTYWTPDAAISAVAGAAGKAFADTGSDIFSIANVLKYALYAGIGIVIIIVLYFVFKNVKKLFDDGDNNVNEMFDDGD